MSAPPPAFDRTPGACSACAQQKGEKPEERHRRERGHQRECSQQRLMGSAAIVTAHPASIVLLCPQPILWSAAWSARRSCTCTAIRAPERTG